MTSPGNKKEQEDRLQRRINRWATANLDPKKHPEGQIKLRGQAKLIKKFGQDTILRVQKAAKDHRLQVWVNLRKVHGLPAFKPSKEEKKILGIRKEKVLFTRTKLGVSKVQDSRGQIHWRSIKTGRFVKQPRRHRSRKA